MLPANAQTRLSPTRCTSRVTEHPAADDGDFLDSGLYGAPAAAGESDPAAPPYGAAPVNATGAPSWKAALRPAAWLAAGVVTGAVVVAAWHSSQTSTPLNPAAAQGQLPNGQGGPGGQVPGGQGPGGQVPGGQGPGGQFPGGPGPGGMPGNGGPGFGGRPGEQHVGGTVTAVGSSTVTVKLADGTTATYAVIASSDIVKNGARVSLSAIKVGDAVFLHVYPSNGQTVVEHLFAGTTPARGDDGTTKT